MIQQNQKKTTNSTSNSAKKKMAQVISEENEVTKINLKDVTPNARIEDHILIRVKSNVFGTLVYKNQKNGEETHWSMCGEVQTMSMGDLRAMKANQASFFTNQWIVILGVDDSTECNAKPADIYKILGITRYYENIVEPSNFESVCNWSVNEIEQRVSLLSDGAKMNLVIALNEYIKNGALDSVKRVKAFEKALGCSLADVD